MSITLHIHPDQFKVDLGLASSSHPAYATVQFDTTRDVILFLDSMGRCDALIAAATQAKYLLAEAEKNRLRQDGEALGRRIAADEGIEPERCDRAHPNHGTVCEEPPGHEGDHRDLAGSTWPQLYVVVNVEPDGRRVVVTDPGLKGQVERFIAENASFYAGTLEAAPARPEDLDDADGES